MKNTGKTEPKKVAVASAKKDFSKEKCSECGKGFGESRVYYTYPGSKKGGFEITKETLFCKECLEKEFDTSKGPDLKVESTIALALQATDDARLKEALELLDKDRTGDDPSYWYTRANIQANLKDYDGALKSYDEALFLDTHYIKAWYRKGNILVLRKDWDDAIKCYENVMALDSEDKDKDKSWYKAALILKAVTILLGWGQMVRDTVKKTQGRAGERKLTDNEIKAALLDSANKWERKYGTEDVRELLKQVYYSIKNNKNLRGLPAENRIDTAIKEGKFADILVQNYNSILDAVEPNVVVQVDLRWEKH